MQSQGYASLDIGRPMEGVKHPWGKWEWRKGRKTGNVTILVPALCGNRWIHPIELYAYRARMRTEGNYVQADWVSQIVNLCGLKRRARYGTKRRQMSAEK
jgi:hypothetical protein